MSAAPRALLLLALAAASAAGKGPIDELAPPARSRAPDDVFFRHILATHQRGDGPYALAPAPTRARRKVRGFVLADDLGCREPGPDADFCALAAPKPWTEEELDRFSALLESLHRSGLGGFMEAVRRGGFDTFLRETSVTHRRDGRWRKLPYPNSIHSNKQFVVGDHQFAMPRPERALVHVLAHARDFTRRRGPLFLPARSHSPEFLRLTGFRVGERGRWELDRLDPKQRARFTELFDARNDALAEMSSAERAARESKIRAAGERFAEPHKVPNFHSMLNPWEAYAEWAALAHFEPERARAVDPALARWMSRELRP